MTVARRNIKRFRIQWDSDRQLSPCGRFFIRDSGDGKRIDVDDEVYVITGGSRSRLLARLSVQQVQHDKSRMRIELLVGGPGTAFFFSTPNSAYEISLGDDLELVLHREARLVDEKTAEMLSNACGSHDFSKSAKPLRWNAIKRQTTVAIARARRYGHSNPDVEIAEQFLRSKFLTSELPGPYPVYQSAARLIVHDGAMPARGICRPRHIMTSGTVRNGINNDVAIAGHSPNTRRHQEILEQLRIRLKELGLCPKYDGYVDCIVELDELDVYFEVKSCSDDSVTHQVRTGLGQVLHYLWIDRIDNPRRITGHLVVQGPWSDRREDLKSFVESCSVRLTWSDEIPSLQVSDLDPP